MSPDYPTYELLARHLDAQFGNIYEYNMAGGDVGYDFQEWTGELRVAVRKYLLHNIPPDVRRQLLSTDDSPVTDKNIEERVEQLLRTQPWEVALEVRNAAVAAVPSLRQLLDNLDGWPSEDERLDAVTWLEAHSTLAEWREVAMASKHPDLLDSGPWGEMPSLRPDDLVEKLTPAELVRAWDFSVGPAATDLTEEQWNLLLPGIEERRGRYGSHPRSSWDLENKRRTFNAIRFRLDRDLSWSHLPARYGDAPSLRAIYRYYQNTGLFARLRDGLKDNTDAVALVAWLDQVMAVEPRKLHGKRSTD
ncbi:transposase [Nocardia vulneris]|uniref:transposase n=1 Tax=Nocardia vulneris TaxID=1141657 RepID=UPI0030D56FF1